MSRVVAGLGAALVVTVLILGPGRALLAGPARAQLPDAATTGARGGQVDAGPPTAVSGPVAATPGANAARLSLAARPADKLTQGYLLSVRVAGPDSRPMNETNVRFYEIVELFGQREMYIGETTTDGQGTASLLYLPAQLGTHQVIARSAGRGQVTWGETRVTFEAQVAAAPYRVEPPPLAAFSAILPYGVGVIVLSVWILLAFALFGTARGVLGGARDHAQGKGETP